MKILSNNCKSVLLIFWAILFCNIALAQSEPHPFRYEGFTGGMMVHTGFVWAKGLSLTSPGGEALPKAKMSGMPLGIGGAVKVHFGQHLRIGSEGYSTKLSYGVKGSYSHIGWGGVLVDGYWEVGKWNLFVGGTIGGGGSTNVTLTNPYHVDETTEENVSFRKYSFMCLCPFVGFEYALTEKVHLTAKVDWLFNVSNPQPDCPMGPRLYLGFMFRHKRAGMPESSK